MRPLEGMLVVDLTIWMYGPLATTLLADLGARVVKIERPGTGDFTRALPTLQGASMLHADGRNVSFELFNRNKESIALDLRTAEGQAILHALVAQADAFVTNFQPSSLKAFGAEPSALLATNPSLVIGLGAGLGTKGNFADVPSQDTAAMAYAGFMFTSSPSPDEPFYPPGGMADVMAGTNLAFGVVSALLARAHDEEGRGRIVTTSLLQSLMWTQLLGIGVPANNGQTLKGPHRSRASSPLMNTYLCADGKWIALGHPYLDDAVWTKIVATLDAPVLLADARFASEALRWEHRGAILAELDARIATRPLADWIARCRAHEVWCSPVNRAHDLARDPDVVTEGLFARTDAGIHHVRAPFTIDDEAPPTRDAPPLGRDTSRVLSELGFGDDEIARLRGAKVIA